MSNRIGCVMACALLATTAAWAGAQYESPMSSCTALNCSGMTIRGIQQSNEPFVIQVYARAGECLRLDIGQQSEDAAMVVLYPSVFYEWYNDDRDHDGGDFRPLIGIDPVPWTGWYTVVVSYFDLDDRVTRFTLDYGRYPGGNINCQFEIPASQSLKRLNQPANSMLGRDAGKTREE